MSILPRRYAPRPGYAVLFATSLPLLLGTLLSDWAYSRTFEIQWTNFASWLNVGALIIIGLALAWSLVAAIIHSETRGSRAWIGVTLVVAVFVLGFINALVHAKDAWAAMPAAFILSIIVFLLALVAAWIELNTQKAEIA